MSLLPGCGLVVAPRFHLEGDWADRVRIGGGVEDIDGRYFPRGPWRAPTAAELAVLAPAARTGSHPLPVLGAGRPPAEVAADIPNDSLALFQVPDHLRSVWWDLLDESAGSGGPLRGFDGFAARVGEFLGFKRLGVPAPVRMEAVVTAAGERSIRRDATADRPSGLGPTVAPWRAWPPGASAPGPHLWGLVNLGDEDTGVVFLNLALPGLAAELARREPDANPATVGELVARFLRACPDYPPVRLWLGAGEGLRVPEAGVVLDGDPTGKEEPDILLLISGDGSPHAGGSGA